MAKGYKMQTGCESHENLEDLLNKQVFGFRQKLQRKDQIEQALDYYYQGLRLDGRHFGCCFNIAIVFLQKGMNKNSSKWFEMARRLNPKSKESFLGVAITTLKLGMHDYCVKMINMRPQKQGRVTRKKSGRLSTLSANIHTEGTPS
mmetsp:Transcript_5171/g.7973  ORF Transcript_5171/g.7973 Transcript_5171/m.7973 type:complete len:146 (+) Transcript_5171:2066-2503(+)